MTINVGGCGGFLEVKVQFHRKPIYNFVTPTVSLNWQTQAHQNKSIFEKIGLFIFNNIPNSANANLEIFI